MHRSSAAQGSSTRSSNQGSGPNFYSSKYIWHSSGAIGSNKYHGGSGKKGSDYNRQYNVFSPTRRPTESLPEVYKPPTPTFQPTVTLTVPELPLSFPSLMSSGNIQIPEIPLSFQIQQGANGWAQYPDSPPVTKAVTKVAAKTTGLKETDVTNMKIVRKNRRALSTAVTITYDITTTPESVGLKSQQATYDLLIYKLQLSVKNNNFSTELHKLGIQLNISSIGFSEYTVFYPTMTPTVKQNVLTSDGLKNGTPTIESVFICFGILLVLFIIGSFGLLLYRYHISKSTEKESEIQPRPEVSMVDRPVSLARVSNPMIDVIPKQTNRISYDQT